ncbi:unnamed protein product [Staurois parvus]|uniref:Uncharacterized protein n=1 Tax=Staurois parvus TaxID=386267 RepID=A0ABN9DWM4_9NEOB|nr:unnamed protein product [Staurois parvus]
MDRRVMTKRILDLTMEIIYLLTGEKYAAVKLTFIEGLLNVLGGRGRSQRPILEPEPNSLTSERNNDKKIIEVSQKIIDLLTGEVSGAGNSRTFSSNRQGMCLDGDCIIVC